MPFADYLQRGLAAAVFIPNIINAIWHQFAELRPNAKVSETLPGGQKRKMYHLS
jgi:hypothetical protein